MKKTRISVLLMILTCLFDCSCGSNKSTGASNDRTLEKDSMIKGEHDDTITHTQNTNERIDTIYNATNYDIDGDGKRDNVLLFRSNGSVFLEINSQSPVNLNTESLNLIETKNGKPTPVVFCDFNTDKKVEIMIAAADSIMEDESFVKIFSYQNSIIKQERFYYSDSDFFDYLIAKENFIAVDSITGNIYCCTNTVTSDNSDSGIMYKIDNYVWDQDKNNIFLKGSKKYDENVFKRPQKVFNK